MGLLLFLHHNIIPAEVLAPTIIIIIIIIIITIVIIYNEYIMKYLMKNVA